MILSRNIIKNILVFLVLIVSGCGNQDNAETASLREAQKQISQSEKLKNLDKICRSLPVFEDFEPKRISIGRKGDILFYYYKLKTNLSEVQSKIKESLPPNGWVLKRELTGDLEYQAEFEKENYWIQVSYHEFTEINYSTNCKDLSIANR
mgnify:CR=1 FL=1